jgi:acyl-CoA thioester hydrolase
MMAQAFSHPVRVYYEDTDAAGVVYYANYLKFMERARTEWMAALGFPVAELEAAQGIVFVVAHIEVSYRSPARLGDLLDVGVTLEECGRARVIATHAVRRGDTLLATARVKLACVQTRSLKPVRIPSSLLESLT